MNSKKPVVPRLDSASSKVIDTDQLIEDGGSFTISCESFFVKENHDKHESGNDLLVRSRTKYGNEPRIETIHFFAKDVPDGFVGENLQSEHVFAKQNHDENNRVWLEVEITEIDRGLKADQNLGDSIRNISGIFGGVFPPILPFTGIASNIINFFEALGSRREQNKEIFQNSLDLYKAGTGETPLRCGAYIFFREDVEGVMYKLRELKLERAAKNQPGPPLHDYIVIKVVPDIIHSGDQEELLTNQDLAAVLSELEEGEKKDPLAMSQHLKFLQEKIHNSRNMKDIEYYYSLLNKKKFGGVLTTSQQDGLIQIAQRLEKYLPSNEL